MTLYERMKQACEERDTNITTVLREVGLSGGNTGSWKAGKSPSLDAIMLIADHLNMSIDELVYGKSGAASKGHPLTAEQEEWLEILDAIPEDRREMCKDFLKTHMVVPEKYSGKISG